MTKLLTTSEVAEHLAVSEEWVRAHAPELGAVKLGGHRAGPLRFAPARVERYLLERTLEAERRAPRRRPGPRPGAARTMAFRQRLT